MKQKNLNTKITGILLTLLSTLLCGAAMRTLTATECSNAVQAASTSKTEAPLFATMILQGKHYVLYINGTPVTQNGWVEVSNGKFLIDSDGYLSAYMEQVDDSWKFYEYDLQTMHWDLQKDIWEILLGKLYYFDASGTCIRIFDTDSGFLQVNYNGRMTSANNAVYSLNDDNLYYFDSNGIRSTEPGWRKISSTISYYVNADGSVTSKMTRTGATWNCADYSNTNWEPQKNIWKIIGGKDYFFNAKGICTKIYTLNTAKCHKYANGKMVLVKNKTCTLRNGKKYFFNSQGTRKTKKGWQKISSKKFLQIGKNGYVISQLTNTDKTWKYFQYNYQSKKWEIQKKIWKTILQKKYYFNASGTCIRIYHIDTRKCFDYNKGEKSLAKNSARNVDGIKYYFGNNGKKVNSAGLYLTSSNRIIYANSNGRVTKTIPGKILEYSISKNKVTSCSTKDSHYIYYYNAKGVLTKKINANK